MEAHKVDPTTGEDEMALAAAPLAPMLVGNGRIRRGRPQPEKSGELGQGRRDQPCPCGSGKKFKTLSRQV